MKIGIFVGQAFKVGIALIVMLFMSALTLSAAVVDGLVTSGASNALYTCLPCGETTSKELIGGMELETRVYGLEDAKILRALSYRDAKMINYMTQMPNVKCKERLYREELRFQFQSAASGGRGAKDCGPFKSSGEYRKPTDKYVKAFYVYIETSICYKKLIGTFKQSKLKAGAGKSEENTSLNDFVITSMLRDANRQTDQLILMGDYGSADPVLTHYDGLLKLAYQAVAAGGAAAKNTYTFAGIVAGDYIQIRAGGQVLTEAFDTDLATTVDNAVAALAAINGYDGVATYTVTNPTDPEMGVESSSPNRPVDIEVWVTKNAGFDECGAPITAGTGTVAITVDQKVDTANDTPMSIAYQAVTHNNAIDIAASIADELGARNTGVFSDDALDMDNFFIHVSPRVMGTLRIAHTKLTGTGGANKLNEMQSEQIFGLNFVEQNTMPDNIFFGSEKANLFFGTDLASDIGEVDVWSDKNCQEVRMRMEARQGVQIDRLRDVLVNFTGLTWTFQTAQPMDC